MATQPRKEKEQLKKDTSLINSAQNKKTLKQKKQTEEEPDNLEDSDKKAIKTTGKKPTSSKDDFGEDNDIEGSIIEEDDTHRKTEEDEDWDPDFNEFDLPKSVSKGSTAKKAPKDDDEFKIDDEFKDFFSDSRSRYNRDEDDDY